MPTPTKGPRLGGGPAHQRLILANLAQALFDGVFLAAGDDQQPFVRGQPLQRGLAAGDQGQGHREFQAEGLVHGGGEGRTSGGRHPVTPWGKGTKGNKTRTNKATDKYILRSRHAKKGR